MVSAHIDAFGTPRPNDTVNCQRRTVVDDCRNAAASEPGLFTLTVPTGGGKTLSSLLFALLHAIAHGQTRIIVVVPFTSVIDQNAQTIRDILAPLQHENFTPLIEHHSTICPDEQTGQSRLAAENWDAPIIITTAVQFYESLFAANTSRCRKLHRIANSVVILDEAQTLRVDFLAPCLRVLSELTAHYRTTAVLCTATQPAIHYHAEEFPIGLQGCREIIRDTGSLFSALKRVKVSVIGESSDADLARRLSHHPQVLCIVNRREHARALFRRMEERDGNFHLSALMCPEHRSQILRQVRRRLDEGLSVRLIATPLIEAGVDVDFPIVYRALAGLDSIAQAAGRCNRNGRIPLGHTFIFVPEDECAEIHFRETAQVARQLIDLHPDLLAQDAIRHYFELYYYQQKLRWDFRNILGPASFRVDGRDSSLPFKFQFATVEKNFKLIDAQVPVLIPFDDHASQLIAELRNTDLPLQRNVLRALQRYTIQVSSDHLRYHKSSFEALRGGQVHTLVSCDRSYSRHFGLHYFGLPCD